MINRYNDKQLLIIKATAKYKYLSYSQLIRLGIDAHKSTLCKLTKDLTECRFPLLKKIPHRPGYELKFYLTKKGKEFLIKHQQMEEQNIHYPKSPIVTTTQDEAHRHSTINFQIELDLACQKSEIDVIQMDRYFDMAGSARERTLKSKTAIFFEGQKTLKADLTFMLQIGKSKELYLAEIERGQSSKKAAQKMINHGKAILLGSANELYSFQKAYRTLWIFEHEGTMNATIKRLEGNLFFTNLIEFFLCKPLDKIGIDFFDGWVNLVGSERKLYYL